MSRTVQDPISPYVAILAPLIRQSGIAVIFAAVLGYAVVRVYADLGHRNEVLVELVTKQVESSQDVANSVTALVSVMEKQSEAINRLERSISQEP